MDISRFYPKDVEVRACAFVLCLEWFSIKFNVCNTFEHKKLPRWVPWDGKNYVENGAEYNPSGGVGLCNHDL